MSSRACCVCNAPVDERSRTIGRRYYCDEHYAKVGRGRGHFWHSGWVLVAALIGFILVVSITTYAKPTLEGGALIVTGIILALLRGGATGAQIRREGVPDVHRPRPRAGQAGVC